MKRSCVVYIILCFFLVLLCCCKRCCVDVSTSYGTAQTQDRDYHLLLNPYHYFQFFSRPCGTILADNSPALGAFLGNAVHSSH